MCVCVCVCVLIFKGFLVILFIPHSECDADEFTCDNGLCINATQTCDGNFDCSNGEDEFCTTTTPSTTAPPTTTRELIHLYGVGEP